MTSLVARAKRRLNETELLRKVRPYTLLTAEKLRNLKRLAALIDAENIAGDLVECGTYKGGSAAVLATALTPERHLWLYDSFEGMPEVREIDGEGAKEAVGLCRADESDVREVLSLLGVSGEQYTIRKGMFEETFKQPLPGQVALLHCDCDWYDSVLLVLKSFYPLIPEGGCIILDDFGWWEGTRIAFYDFCDEFGEKPLLERIGADQAYWIKGKAHNRG
ncbi:MAG TPA: TylF/MycF/NovP-related O-methyltransferase [Pyrinomonadaceae bacterium]